MPSWKSAVIGSLCFNAAEGLRSHRKNTNTKMIAGVPVHNYHLAFDRTRWESESHLQMISSELAEHEEHWVLMMRPGTTDAELARVCKAHQCETHGHSDGVPFVAIRASVAELTGVLTAEKNGVAFAEPDLEFHATPEVSITDSDEVPWGIRRIRTRDLDGQPSVDPGPADGGAGVHVYVLDTGIRNSHEQFGGRVIPTLQTKWKGFSIMECKGKLDCALDFQGHGTHCSGTIGGKTFGVAKAVTLHAVKVLGDDGAGNGIGIMAAEDWVARNHIKPAVASMSLGGGFAESLNDAADAMVAQGVVVVTASGNSNADGCDFSPGSAPWAINVGSSDQDDGRSYFSNYGRCLDIYAPGRDILSSVHDSDTASKAYSGTSMACPHVSGAAAMLLSKEPELTPAQVKDQLVLAATPDVVTDAKVGSPNLMLYSP